MYNLLLTAGHGGTDPGAVGKVTEHDVAMKCCNSLKKSIEEKSNAKVKVISEKNSNGEFLNDYPDIPVKNSNHLNGSDDKSAHGTEFIIDNNSGAIDLMNAILEVMENHGFKNRGIKNNENLYVLNYDEMLNKDFNHIFEWGFVTNDDDVDRLLNNLKSITDDIADCYINYYNWERKEEEYEMKRLADKYSRAEILEDEHVRYGGKYKIKTKRDLKLMQINRETGAIHATDVEVKKGTYLTTDYYKKIKSKSNGYTYNYHAIVNSDPRNTNLNVIAVDCDGDK